MSETPAAAPAAPAAPAVVDPAAAAAPAAPAAAVAPAAVEPQSIIPADPGKADPAPAAAPVAAKADPNAPLPAEWFLSPGVKGTGEAPAYFKADKYKTLADQAEAYGHLEKRLGAFVGAPKDGKYEFKLPEGVTGEFDQEHPMYKSFVEKAAGMQISNEGFNELMGMFAAYEASLAPDPAVNLAEAKKALGETADARIRAAALWVQGNLSPELYKDFRYATNAAEFNGEQIARVVSLVEGAIAKGRVVLPKHDETVPSQGNSKQQALAALLAKKDAKGNVMYFNSHETAHRAAIDKMRNEIMAEQGVG